MSTALSRQVGGVSLATQSHYIIRRKFWSVFERVFRVFTGDGQLIMYIQHPLLKLREEFIGYAEEQGAALLRRLFPLLPSKHAVFVAGDEVAMIRQRFRLFTKEFTVDTRPSSVDPRFVLAVALLALIAEARRE